MNASQGLSEVHVTSHVGEEGVVSLSVVIKPVSSPVLAGIHWRRAAREHPVEVNCGVLKCLLGVCGTVLYILLQKWVWQLALLILHAVIKATVAFWLVVVGLLITFKLLDCSFGACWTICCCCSCGSGGGCYQLTSIPDFMWWN